MKYWSGVNDAVASVQKMNREELIEHINILYGFKSLFKKIGLPVHELETETIRQEAIRQTFKDFELPKSMKDAG